MRNLFQIMLSVVVLAATAATQGSSSQNVLFLLADDLGVDQVGCYQEGSAPPPTPTIDALAARGVLFRNAWSNPTCSPTRTSINTGRYTFRHSVGDWIRYATNGTRTGSLKEREVTLPEALDLAGSGYEHVAIGKWHMNPIEEGPMYPHTVGGYGDFFGTMSSPNSFYSYERVVNGAVSWSTNYVTTEQVDDAIAWIQTRSGPWFCYLAFSAPHSPYHAPPAALHSRNLTGLNPNGSNADKREFYKAATEAMDLEIGRLLATLGPAVMANTNVIFLGDNGTPLGLAEAPFLPTQGKTTPYEGGINVPLIIAGPQVLGTPREEARLVHVVDLFSTVLDLADAEHGVPSYVEIDGHSLLPCLQSPAAPITRTTVFSDRWRGDAWPDPVTDLSGFGMAMVRDDRFKYIQRNTGGRELYDLQTDPFETQNLLLGTLTAPQSLRYGALRAEMNALRTAPRRVFPYGDNACQGASGTPSIHIGGVPRLGDTYAVQALSAAPGRPGVLTTGFSASTYAGMPLPFDLGSLGGGPGCLLENSVELQMPVLTTAFGVCSAPISVPNAPIFVDLPLYHSFVIDDPLAPGNALDLVTSKAVVVRLGT